MNDIDNQAQIAHLLAVVEHHRDERCERLRAQARSQVQRTLQQAHADARAHMHQHIVGLREKAREHTIAARARNETRIRLQHQRASREMIDQAWPLLRESLLSRWSNTDSRQSWIQAALDSATRTLLVKDWRIEHPASWPTAEIEQLRQQIQVLTGRMPVFDAYDDIDAGLRFIGGGATVDASIGGLLQLHRRIEAQLLARLEPAGSRTEHESDGLVDG